MTSAWASLNVQVMRWSHTHTHTAHRHERSRDVNNLEDALDLEVRVALEVERQLAFIQKLLSAAYDEVLVPSAAGKLHREPAIARIVPQVHDMLTAARIHRDLNLGVDPRVDSNNLANHQAVNGCSTDTELACLEVNLSCGHRAYVFPKCPKQK